MNTWNKTYKYLQSQISDYKIVYKKDDKLQIFLSTIMFWVDYNDFWSAWGNRLYLPQWFDEEHQKYSFAISALQHEGTHNLDSVTFFGLLPNVHWRINTVLFSLVYLFPNWLAIFSLLSIPFGIEWLAFLLFLPAPFAPGRAFAELRAFRRDVEFGREPESIVEYFQGKDYWFMLPIPKKYLIELLQKKSAYGERFDLL